MRICLESTLVFLQSVQFSIHKDEAILNYFGLKTVFFTFFERDFSLDVILIYPNACTQPAFTCSKLTKETIEQGVKYVQS